MESSLENLINIQTVSKFNGIYEVKTTYYHETEFCMLVEYLKESRIDLGLSFCPSAGHSAFFAPE